MTILTIRTDKPEAELGLYNDTECLGYKTWLAHRELAETIHLKLQTLLEERHKTLEDVQGIVVYEGPGSFTGLRIGITVTNTLACSLQVPIVGATGDNWITYGVQRITGGETETAVLPEYGAPVHITIPKK